MEYDASTGALSGLRIIDSTTMVAMPTGTHIMADMGAEVIKVESHTLFRTEEARVLYADNEPGDQPWNREGSFNALQRSKFGITLNLKTPEGIAAFKELVMISDVLVENNRAGTMDRLGLSYETLRRIKPDLIYVSNTGFGYTGPWQRYAGIGRMFELTCGLSQFTGYPGHGPRRVGKAFFDLHVGWMSVFAIMAALHYRQQTGKGQWIDFSMYQVGVSTMGDAILDYIVNNRNGEIMGNRHPYFAPHGVYPCKGCDEWIAIAIETDEQWETLCHVIGDPKWSQEIQFTTQQSRWDHQQELDKHIQNWTKNQDHLELMSKLQEHGIPASAVMNSREVLTDPHMKARGFYEKVTHSPDSGIGTKLYFGRPWKMSETPSFIRRPAPTLGEHNEDLLGTLLGKTQTEIEKLYQIGVLGKVPEIPPTYQPPSINKQIEDGTLRGFDVDYRKIVGLE